MLKRTSLLSLFAAVALVVACQPADEADGEMAEGEDQAMMEEDAEAIRAAVRENVESFLAAFNAGDAQAAAPLYAEDVVQLAPDQPVLEGRAATIQALDEFLGQFSTPPTQTAAIDEIMVHGDLAIARGTWQVTQTPEGGEQVTRNGKWMTVLEPGGDGSYVVTRWMWNEQGTAPEM